MTRQPVEGEAVNGERAAQAIADAVREVFDGHCGTGARVDPEPPSWEQVGREVVAALAAEGGVVVWLGDAATVDAVAMRLCALENGDTGMVWDNSDVNLRDDYREDARAVLSALSPVSAETTESEQ